MSDYTCPNCRGEFPVTDSVDSRDKCPWCGQEFGEYDAPDGVPIVKKSVSKTERKEPTPLLGKLWSDSDE